MKQHQRVLLALVVFPIAMLVFIGCFWREALPLRSVTHHTYSDFHLESLAAGVKEELLNRSNFEQLFHIEDLPRGNYSMWNETLHSANKTPGFMAQPSRVSFKTSISKRLKDFPFKITKKVKKFVLFVGYTRSGHSIIGTLMDAHPHVVISNEFNLFTKFKELNKVSYKTWKYNLFDMIYKKSAYDVWHSRGNPRKGYLLTVRGLWQGKFNEYVTAIGDKSGDVTTRAYAENRTEFLSNYKLLKKRLKIPIRIIHAVRNPYDMIATSAVIWNSGLEKFRKLKHTYSSNTTKGKGSSVRKFNNPGIVNSSINHVFDMFATAKELIEKVFGRKNVLDVHNCDLVADPKGTISRIFEFIGVATTSHYLDVCAGKVFRNVSRSRHTVVWSEEQKKQVEKKMREYRVLDRYSFTSD